MADMKDFPFNSDKEHELKLGSSFSPGGRAESAFHTIRCEYAPKCGFRGPRAAENFLQLVFTSCYPMPVTLNILLVTCLPQILWFILLVYRFDCLGFFYFFI